MRNYAMSTGCAARGLSGSHGMATRYLPNYLGWHWILDVRRIISPESSPKATMGSVPHLMMT